MSNIITFQYDAYVDIEYDSDEGHYYVPVPAFYSAENHANRVVDFMIDTGAFLTIITPQMAVHLGYDKLTPINPDILLSGYTGVKHIRAF